MSLSPSYCVKSLFVLGYYSQNFLIYPLVTTTESIFFFSFDFFDSIWVNESSGISLSDGLGGRDESSDNIEPSLFKLDVLSRIISMTSSRVIWSWFVYEISILSLSFSLITLEFQSESEGGRETALPPFVKTLALSIVLKMTRIPSSHKMRAINLWKNANKPVAEIKKHFEPKKAQRKQAHRPMF